MGFLARWARRLSWKETAQVFQTSWEAVYRSVEWFVEWGLAHRQLEKVHSLGIDELHWGRGKRADNFITVIYQLDQGCRRLLWVGRRRTQATLKRGLQVLGPEVMKGLRFVCSDMWKPYLQVIAQQCPQAVHVLDRFHVTLHLNQAVDEVRRSESMCLRAAGKASAQRLKHMPFNSETIQSMAHVGFIAPASGTLLLCLMWIVLSQPLAKPAEPTSAIAPVRARPARLNLPSAG